MAAGPNEFEHVQEAGVASAPNLSGACVRRFELVVDHLAAIVFERHSRDARRGLHFHEPIRVLIQMSAAHARETHDLLLGGQCQTTSPAGVCRRRTIGVRIEAKETEHQRLIRGVRNRASDEFACH
jgi:hypothetical protein